MTFPTQILAIVAMLINVSLQGQTPDNETLAVSKPTILFVCEHGAGRSAIAASFFNRIAKEKKLNYRAIFRGIHPDSAIGPSIQRGLIQDSFDMRGLRPVAISNMDIEQAKQIVLLDCVLPQENDKLKSARQWKGIPIQESYYAARDELLNRINELVLQLLAEQERRN